MEMTGKTSAREQIPQSTIVSAFGSAVEFDKVLAEFTGYKTGGSATYFLMAESVEQISAAIKATATLGISCFVLGGGSNVLIADSGFDGLIIKINVRGMRLVNDTQVECGSGETLMDLVNYCADHGLTGFEFASGIAGSVGGAIYGNAGAYGGETGNLVSQMVLVDTVGGTATVGREHGKFAYRDSAFKTNGEVVASATFDLETGDKKSIRAKIDEILATRKEKLPDEADSAGCFFKNIPDSREKYGKLPAGRLLEEVGAKNMSVGGAKVSDKHANIIVNSGGATSKDIRQLADMLKERVKAKFGTTLEEEVIQIGRF